MTNSLPRVALVANTSWYLYNFRSNLMSALQSKGYAVWAFAPKDDYSSRLEEAGIRFHNCPIDRRGMNPFRELRTAIVLHRMFRREKIDAVLSFTPKGNIYSGLAISGRTKTFIANISGVGCSFSSGKSLRMLSTVLFKSALMRATQVFFQNDNDLEMFQQMKAISADRAILIPGSGVDLGRFAPRHGRRTASKDAVTFLMVARLIWDKGVGQYVASARMLKARYPNSRFQILGDLERGRDAVPEQELRSWVQDGTIEYLGFTDDVRSLIAEADCIVLPSFYREGVPRSLLEAAAMAKPIITCDIPGCRNAVADGVSGYLCRPGDTEDLARQLERFIALGADERYAMGKNGRAKMEREFDEQFVIDRYLWTMSQSFMQGNIAYTPEPAEMQISDVDG